MSYSQSVTLGPPMEWFRGASHWRTSRRSYPHQGDTTFRCSAGPVVTSIVEFLHARLAEDQANCAEVHARDCECLKALPLSCDCAGPARALREVEAKRRIVNEHKPVHPVLLREGAPSSDEGQTILSYCPVCETEEPPCPTLRALASVYADHPECQREWVL